MNLKRQEHLLVFRFSSLGDVAMTVPVIRLLLLQHPGLRVTVVSTALMKPLFRGLERCAFVEADLKGKHKGIPGLFRLYRRLSKNRYSGIADLHQVIRTSILRFFFKPHFIKTAIIDKGRKEKKELTRQVNKKLRPLKSTFQRYADVFGKLGYPVKLEVQEGISRVPIPEKLSELKKKGLVLIGIAPFALHREKTYPPERMKQVVKFLSNNDSLRIFLLGGKKDAEMLERWELQFSNVESWAGKMKFEAELEHIAALDLVVSMDSANMHLASMFGVPVVSIWGGTHPYLGFYGWGQSPENIIQANLDCRPSSVFGNKACRNDLKCMDMISPIVVFEQIIRQLKLKHYEISGNQA